MVKYKNKIDKDKAAIKNQSISKNSDIVAVNKNIREVNGEFVAVLFAENTVARAKNRMEE